MLQSWGSVTDCQLESSKPGAAASGFDGSPYLPVVSVAASARVTSWNFQPSSKLVVRVPWLSTPRLGSAGGAASVCDLAACVHASTATNAMSAGTTPRAAILNTPLSSSFAPPDCWRSPRLYRQKAQASTCKAQLSKPLAGRPGRQ